MARETTASKQRVGAGLVAKPAIAKLTVRSLLPALEPGQLFGMSACPSIRSLGVSLAPAQGEARLRSRRRHLHEAWPTHRRRSVRVPPMKSTAGAIQVRGEWTLLAVSCISGCPSRANLPALISESSTSTPPCVPALGVNLEKQSDRPRAYLPTPLRGQRGRGSGGNPQEEYVLMTSQVGQRGRARPLTSR